MASLYDLYLGMFISFSIIIIIANLAVIAIILFSPVLRKTISHMLIVSTAGVDLLLGCFVLPMFIRSLVETHEPTCHLHVALQVIGDHGIFFICGWSMFTLDLVILYKMADIRRKCRWPQYVTAPIICLWPWISACALIVPLILSVAPSVPIHKSHWADPMCLMELPRPVLTLMNTITLYVPMFLCVVTAASLIVFYTKKELCQRESPYTTTPSLVEENVTVTRNYDEDDSYIGADHPLSVCVPNLVYILCYTPTVIFSIFRLSSDESKHGNLEMPALVLIPMLSRSVAVPLSWLSLNSVRAEAASWNTSFWNFLRSCTTGLMKSPSTVLSSTISFSKLREVQSV